MTLIYIFVSDRGVREDLVHSLLTRACRHGHLELVKTLVDTYNVDVRDCSDRQEFTHITELPLYAAAEAGMYMNRTRSYSYCDKSVLSFLINVLALKCFRPEVPNLFSMELG